MPAGSYNQRVDVWWQLAGVLCIRCDHASVSGLVIFDLAGYLGQITRRSSRPPLLPSLRYGRPTAELGRYQLSQQRIVTTVRNGSILLKNSLFARRTFGRRRDRQSIGEENERASALERYAGRPFASSCTVGINRLAIRRRFCAIAAIKNSSCAPCRPRKRNRSSRRMRLR